MKASALVCLGVFVMGFAVAAASAAFAREIDHTPMELATKVSSASISEAPEHSEVLAHEGVETVEQRVLRTAQAGTTRRPRITKPRTNKPRRKPRLPSLTTPNDTPPGITGTLTTVPDTAGRGCSGQCYCETTSQAIECACSAKGIKGPCFVWGCKKTTGAGWHCEGASSSD